MSWAANFKVLREEVLEFRSPWKMAGIIAIGVLMFLACLAFFWRFDGLVWYGALLSQ